jgi:hypothetical protein
MAAKEFIDQLRQLGYEVTEHGGGRISFLYVVESGRFAGQTIQLGFVAPGDFPASSPSGPHVSPRLLPLANGGTHPAGCIQASDEFGPDCKYWSRPLKHWAKTKRSVSDVMVHIRHLFDSQ